ncbi:MAG: hypothetical protein HY326_00930 [Chloroflexi bacterium]|nr:hypothetical protein [Chloroflexota bacterium]
MSHSQRQILPVVLATLALSVVSGLATGATLIIPWPWLLGFAFLAFVTGVLTLAGMTALVKVLSSMAPVSQRYPDPEPERPRWQVVGGKAQAVGMEVDLIEQLREPETHLIWRIEGLPEPKELITLDCAFLLRELFRGNISRADLLGIWLPSQRKLTRPLYDQFMDLASNAGVIQGRKPKYSGRVTPGLTLTQALSAWGIDPASIPWATLGTPGLGKARLGTSGRFLVAKVIDEGRG